MIWFILFALTLLIVLFVLIPLMQDQGTVSTDGAPALDEARAQLKQLESDHQSGRIGDEAATESRRALEHRVLALLDTQRSGVTSLFLYRIIVVCALCFGGLGLYSLVGEPNFGTVESGVVEAPAAGESLEELVVLLQQKLAAEDEQPIEGTVLLARSLMTLGRYDEATEAYEKALELSDNLPQIVDEYARANAYIEAVRTPKDTRTAPETDPNAVGNGAETGPIDRQTLESVQAMSDEERAAMIDGMVAGLAARLATDPDDPEGWNRLIRARVVMGDIEQAQADLESAVVVFEADPETRSRIVANAVTLGLEIPD